MFHKSGKIILKSATKQNFSKFNSSIVPNKLFLNPSLARTSMNQLGSMLSIQSNTFVRNFSTENKQEEEKQKSEENSEEKQEEEKKEETPEQKQIRELSEEINKLKHAYATCLADQENTRRIARQDVKNATDYAVSKLGKSLLEVSDNFDRAIGSMKQEEFNEFIQYFEDHHDNELKKKINQVKSVFNGIKIIKKQLLKTLEGSGITLIEEEKNVKFDPEFHEAIMKQPVPEDAKEKVGYIAHVLSPGYMIKDRILRPTKVVVYIDPNDE